MKVNGNLQGVGNETALRSVLQEAQGQKWGSGNTGSLLWGLSAQPAGTEQKMLCLVSCTFRASASQPQWETPVATDVG